MGSDATASSDSSRPEGLLTIDIAALRQWIGRSAEAEDIVTPRLVEGFRATFDPHLAAVGDGECPLALHWCLAPGAAPMAELGPDGHPAKGGFLPPVPLPRRMWAGGEIETFGPLRLGDRIARRSTISGVEHKAGRSGPLCFVTVRHEFLTGRGPALAERHDIVYRDTERSLPENGEKTPHREAPPDAGPTPDLAWQIEGSPVLLFRYSALTFNGHRIHYDAPYVTGVEGYPGLVVHGPLQATLLFNLAAVLGGRTPSRFRYRAIAPLIAGETFEVLGAHLADGGVSSWTRSSAGQVCMQARAGW